MLDVLVQRRFYLALLCVSFIFGTACTPLLPGGTNTDTSTAAEPPRSWAGVLTLVFYDSTTSPYANYEMTVDFHDGRRWRTVRADELIVRPAYERTPWYRLYFPRNEETEIPIRFTVDHEGGYRTVAEYPLKVETTAIFNVGAFIHTYVENPTRPEHTLYGRRGYPLNPQAPAVPTDSLWVAFTICDRSCFWCPF
jgi:hypothetical protein